MRVSDEMVMAANRHIGHKMDNYIVKGMIEQALLADPITIKARMGLEAQYAHNDTFPGEDYDYGFSTLSEAWDNLQSAIRRIEEATPSRLGGAVENLETARLIMGAALIKHTAK